MNTVVSIDWKERRKAYVVATRNAMSSEGWNNDLPDIARARLNYELGTHTLTTGYENGRAILYSIPQKTVTPRPRYFRLEYADPRSGR
jgi:hypothetical protein